MNLDDYYKSVKTRFPEVSTRADKLYDSYWNSLVKMEFSSYSWFESLANAVNGAMLKGTPSEEVVSMLVDIGHAYTQGEDDLQNAIDVAFVENLFWQVPKDKSKPYWEKLPGNLQDLYVGFHGRSAL
ncbi:DUF7674 family protein [Microbulbifer sp. JMSA002]|uniref:DUF7674 family protein n=1 Tax=Microbulbifer sp. JMSA002 TaxID=3243368 RepID=UPI004039D26E